jgi:hypothetical protein
MDCIRLPYQIARYDASRFAAQIGCRFGAQTIENKSHFSHRNVTCGDMDFRASRLREAQKFIGDSWFRLYHKPAKPRRRLGERRSSYRQEDSEKTPAAGGSNRCERRYGPRKMHRALPRGRRSKSEGHSHSGTDRVHFHELPKMAPTFYVTQFEMIANLSRAYTVSQSETFSLAGVVVGLTKHVRCVSFSV